MSERGPHCETCTCGCTCGYGGQHEPENPHCELNREARAAAVSDPLLYRTELLRYIANDDLAGYPKLCTTCGGTGHVTSYGGVHGDYDTQCSDCNGAGER
jgi:hypothetical protein